MLNIKNFFLILLITINYVSTTLLGVETKEHKEQKERFEAKSSKENLKAKRKHPVTTMNSPLGLPELQLSLKEKETIFELPLFKDELNTYFQYVPFIGRYYGEGYNFLKRIALIENNNLNILENVLDKSIIEQLKNKDIKFFTIIWGSPFNEKPKDKIYNIAFHPTVRSWYKGTEGFDEKNFNKPVAMGIFNANGATPGGNSIAFDKLNPESVNLHPADAGTAFSPDNAQFAISQGRDIAIFWAIAISPDNKNAVVTFNIIIDNDDLEDVFYGLISNSNNISDLVNNINKNFLFLLKSEDAKALTDALTIISSNIETKKEISINELINAILADISLFNNKLINISSYDEKEAMSLSLNEKSNRVQQFIKTLSDVLIKTNELVSILEKLPKDLTEQEAKELDNKLKKVFTNEQLNEIANNFSRFAQERGIFVLTDLKNLNEVSDVFAKFIKSKNKKEFEQDIKNILNNLTFTSKQQSKPEKKAEPEIKAQQEIKQIASRNLETKVIKSADIDDAKINKYLERFPNLFSNTSQHDSIGNTPLTTATQNQDLEIIKFLLDVLGANINGLDSNNSTALMVAAVNGYTDLVEFLLQKGADPYPTNKLGKTARDYANNQEIKNLLNVYY